MKLANPEALVIKIASREVSPCKLTERVAKALNRVVMERKRRLPVVKEEMFQGVVGRRELLDYLGAGSRKKYQSAGATVKRVMRNDLIAIKQNYKVGKVLGLFRTGKQDFYPIVNKGKLVGVLEERNLIKLVNRKLGVQVGDVMTPRPIVARTNWPVSDVAGMMCHGPFERLPVVRDGILVGVVTPHDVLSYLLQSKKALLDKDRTEIKHIMSRDPVTVEPEDDVLEAVKKMKAGAIGFLPVVEDQELVGVVTEKDILRTFKN